MCHLLMMFSIRIERDGVNNSDQKSDQVIDAAYAGFLIQFGSF